MFRFFGSHIKERMGGKIHRKYDIPKTFYQRVIESKEVPEVKKAKKQTLKNVYESLNPAELKKAIDRKLGLLYKVYQEKNKSQRSRHKRKLNQFRLLFIIRQPRKISLT